MKKENPSCRYPRYFRFLRELLQNGIFKISSSEIAERLSIKPTLVRSDLSIFDIAGMSGYGYSVKELYREICAKLGAGDGMKVCFFGSTDEEYIFLKTKLEGRGFVISGRKESTDGEYSADIAVISDGLSVDGKTINELKSHGIKGIWNISQHDICANIPCINMPVGDIAMRLAMEIKETSDEI